MATAAENITAAISSNAETIALYSAALAADAANPQPDYSIDGESVSRDSWRRTLAASIKELTAANHDLYAALIQIEGPTETHAQGTT